MQPRKRINDDSASPWPGMPDQGWLGKFTLPEPSRALLDSFDNLPADRYAPNAQRERRFAQYLAFFNYKRELLLRRLPDRPFIQSAQYNPLSGGIPREFAPIEPQCDVTPYIEQLFTLLQIDRSRKYHLDVHQYRVYGTPDAAGMSVPEGPHMDGMNLVFILVVRRHEITDKSAEFSLIDPVTRQTFFTTVVGEGEGIGLDDQKMLHDASPVIAAGPERGYRDYIVVNVNLLDERRYGRRHEHGAVSGGTVIKDRFAELKRQRAIGKTNDSFERAKALLDQKSVHTIAVVHGIEAAMRSLKDYSDLRFTEQDLIAIKKAALVIGANHYVEAARQRRRDGEHTYGALNNLHEKLAQLKDLKGGEKPDRNDGLNFDRRRLKRLARDPNHWRLQKKAQSDPRLGAWYYRQYPWRFPSC